MSDHRVVRSFWLGPCLDDAARFQSVIDVLTARQSAPRFGPHVSLGSVQDMVGDIAELISLLRGLELTPLEIATGPSFTMSLFVRMKMTRHLQFAREWLEAQPGFTSTRSFDPHLSLCYGAPPEREDIAPEIGALAQHAVRFDRLVIMQIRVPVETHSDVARWTPLAEHSLD